LADGFKAICIRRRCEMPITNARALRYRRLALATADKANADLLLKLADECDRGLLCTTEWLSARPYRKDEQPPKAGDAETRFVWHP
jgi:hypothetical protein